MNFSELSEEIRKTAVEEKRADSNDRLELVVKNGALNEITPILERYFGPAVKPAGKNPSGPNRDLTNPFGGILKNQTLYYADRENCSNLAMIWPWSDGERSTLKIFRLGRAG